MHYEMFEKEPVEKSVAFNAASNRQSKRDRGITGKIVNLIKQKPSKHEEAFAEFLDSSKALYDSRHFNTEAS